MKTSTSTKSLLALLLLTIVSSQAHAYCVPGKHSAVICGEGPHGGFATDQYKVVRPTGTLNQKGNPAHVTTHHSGGVVTGRNKGWK